MKTQFKSLCHHQKRVYVNLIYKCTLFFMYFCVLTWKYKKDKETPSKKTEKLKNRENWFLSRKNSGDEKARLHVTPYVLHSWQGPSEIYHSWYVFFSFLFVSVVDSFCFDSTLTVWFHNENLITQPGIHLYLLSTIYQKSHFKTLQHCIKMAKSI